MSSSVEPIDPNRDAGVTVRLGSTELTLRQFQDLYAELGNGGDFLSRRFQAPFIVEVDDVKNLYQKLQHLISNFQPVAVQEKMSVTHLEDDTQEFDSFTKFLGYDKNKGAPVTSINIEIGFALKSPLPPHDKIREYEVDIFLMSTMAEAKKTASNPIEDFDYNRLMRPPFSAAIRVKYYDYSIAVACMGVAASWIDTLRLNEDLLCYKILAKYKNVSQWILHFLTVFALVAASFVVVARVGVMETAQLPIAVSLILAVALTGNRVAFHLTTRFRSALHLWAAHSVVLLGAGDKRLQEWYDRARKRSFWSQVSTFGGALVLSVIVKMLVEFLLSK
ncbi:MAG: hypothetical protein K2X46_18415 [Roseomonas sp.]|nr:hypothetical protein [Roseomonas sp.]